MKEPRQRKKPKAEEPELIPPGLHVDAQLCATKAQAVRQAICEGYLSQVLDRVREKAELGRLEMVLNTDELVESNMDALTVLEALMPALKARGFDCEIGKGQNSFARACFIMAISWRAMGS